MDKHVNLGLFGRVVFPQIAPPTERRIPEKITQQKDARIRVLVKVGVYHGFPDVAKEAPYYDFHVEET